MKLNEFSPRLYRKTANTSLEVERIQNDGKEVGAVTQVYISTKLVKPMCCYSDME